MNLTELRKNRQITTAQNFTKWVYEVGDNDTLFVIYYGEHTIEECINTSKKWGFDWSKFHNDNFGGYIEQWKNGKFALILDRTYYESESLEELEVKLHKYNLEENYYKQTFFEWFKGGNVIELEKDVFSTQDAQYKNKINGIDALYKYFTKEFNN